MEELLILSRYLEPIRLPVDEAVKLFNKISDKERVGDDTHRIITFKSFAIGCVENNLFSLETQKAFLRVTDKKECVLQLNSMYPKDDRIKMVEERFKAAGEYTPYYASWIEPIKRSLAGDYSKNANVILIKLKLIEAESMRVYVE